MNKRGLRHYFPNKLNSFDRSYFIEKIREDNHFVKNLGIMKRIKSSYELVSIFKFDFYIGKVKAMQLNFLLFNLLQNFKLIIIFDPYFFNQIIFESNDESSKFYSGNIFLTFLSKLMNNVPVSKIEIQFLFFLILIKVDFPKRVKTFDKIFSSLFITFITHCPKFESSLSILFHFFKTIFLIFVNIKIFL